MANEIFQALQNSSTSMGDYARRKDEQNFKLKFIQQQQQQELADAITLHKIKAGLESEQMKQKQLFEMQDPFQQALRKGQLADAQMKMYNAGGPAPSMFQNSQQATPPNIGQGMMSLIAGGVGDVMGRPVMPQSGGQSIGRFGQMAQSSPNELTATSFDQFGRPKGYEDIGLDAKKDALKASEKEKQLNAAKVGRLSNLVDVIEQRYAETKTPQNPIFRFGENISKGLQITPNQRTDKAYANFVSGIRAQLARAMGDVGNLSEFEQKAVLDLIPTLGDDPRTANLKIQNIREFIAQVQKSAQQPNQSSVQNDFNSQNSQIPKQGKTSSGIRYTIEE